MRRDGQAAGVDTTAGAAPGFSMRHLGGKITGSGYAVWQIYRLPGTYRLAGRGYSS